MRLLLAVVALGGGCGKHDLPKPQADAGVLPTDASMSDALDLSTADLTPSDLAGPLDFSGLPDLSSSTDLRPPLMCNDSPDAATNEAPPATSFSTDFARPVQSFPTSLLALQAFFPEATRALIYTFDEPAGAIAEQTGSGPPLHPTGAPHYGLYTPLAPGKHSVSAETVNDGFSPGTSLAFDPGNGPFTVLAWVRLDLDSFVGGLHVLLDKHDLTFNRGFTIWTSLGQFSASVENGPTTVTVGTNQANYATGAWHLLAVSWDPVTHLLSLSTEQESVSTTSSQPSMPLGVESPATVLNGIDGTQPLHGALAYLAFLPAVISNAEVTAFAHYGRPPTNALSFARPIAGGVVGFDRRDFAFGDRVIKWGAAQFPWDMRYGKPAFLSTTTDVNQLIYSEDLEISSIWTPSPTPPAVQAHAAEAPDGAFTATGIQKTTGGSSEVWLQQTFAAYVVGAISGAVWLRADAPHAAALRLLVSGSTVADVTAPVMVDTTWKRFGVSAPVSSPSSLQGTFRIYPAASDDPNAVGTVYAWGASASASSTSAEYYPTFGSSDTARPGTLTASVPLPTPRGFIELALVPTGLPPGERMDFNAPAGMGKQSVSMEFARPYYAVQFADDNGTPFSFNPWDIRKFYVPGVRTHLLLTWDNTSGAVDIFVNGSEPLRAIAPSLPTVLPSLFTLGFDPINGQSQVAIEHVAIGAGMVDNAQAIVMAAAAGVAPTRRIGCIGDSITGFFNGYHARLNELLGPGKAIVTDQGISGNTTYMMLTRFTDAMLGRGYTDAIILGGINDILFYSQQDPGVVEQNLQEMYRIAKCAGMKVVAITLLPAKNNAFGNWTPAKQGIIEQVNAWIRSYPEAVDRVVDGYALFSDPADPASFVSSLTMDGLHPTPAGSDKLGEAVFQQAYDGMPLP